MRITINPTLDMETLKWVSNHGTYEYNGPLAKFDRAGTNEAKTAVAGANDVAAQFGTKANDVNSMLTPMEEKQATNPQGFAPQDVNNMLVAGEQGAGGANAGITGAAALNSARTRNAGGFANSLDEAARIKGRQLSQNSLGVQNENATVKLQQKAEAQKALQGIYGTDTSAQLEAMGLIPKDIGEQTKSQTVGWQQQLGGQAIGDAENAFFAPGGKGAGW
jgi:hypothetical protein